MKVISNNKNTGATEINRSVFNRCAIENFVANVLLKDYCALYFIRMCCHSTYSNPFLKSTKLINILLSLSHVYILILPRNCTY